MNNVAATDIAIIGGGLAGSAMAAALIDSKYSVTLLDARPFPDSPDLTARHQPRVSALTPGTVRLLKSLGAWSKIPASRTSPYTQMHVRETDGTGEINFSADELRIDSLGYIVENHLIQTALLATLTASDNVNLLAPATVTACEKVAEGSVLNLSGGQSLQARLVIAADGARSPIRDILNSLINKPLARYSMMKACWHFCPCQQRAPNQKASMPAPLSGHCNLTWQKP